MLKEEKNQINIIYHDDNVIKFPEEITRDCQEIIKNTKGILVLTKNLNELELLLNFIKQYKPKSKSVIIMNGNSSEKVISFIKKHNYMDLFIKGSIYCQNKQKYEKIFNSNKDFIENLCNDCDSIIAFIKNNFHKIKSNEKFDCDIIMNIFSYNYDYFTNHRSVANFFNKSEFIDSEKFNPVLIKDINNDKNEIYFKIYNFYDSFKNNDNKKFIFKYLKDENLFIPFNQLLIKKNKIDFDNIGYFAGNLMYRIVQYGKKEGKGLINAKELYKGMQIDIINLFEYIKNENLLISFSHFMTVTSKKDLAILNSKRNQNLSERKDSHLFSVLLKIDYLYDNTYEPSIFDLSDLLPYPDEEEFIILPFTFFHIKKVIFDIKKMNADIYLDTIGKTEILEEKVKIGKKLKYDEKNHIIIPS